MHFSFFAALGLAATAAAVPLKLVVPQDHGVVEPFKPIDWTHIKVANPNTYHQARASTLHSDLSQVFDNSERYRSPGITPPWLLNRLRQSTAISQQSQTATSAHARREPIIEPIGRPLRNWNWRLGYPLRPMPAMAKAARAATPIVDETTTDPIDKQSRPQWWRGPSHIGGGAYGPWRSPPFTRPRIGTTVLPKPGAAQDSQGADKREIKSTLHGFYPNWNMGRPRIGTVIPPSGWTTFPNAAPQDKPQRRDDLESVMWKRIADVLME